MLPHLNFRRDCSIATHACRLRPAAALLALCLLVACARVTAPPPTPPLTPPPTLSPTLSPTFAPVLTPVSAQGSIDMAQKLSELDAAMPLASSDRYRIPSQAEQTAFGQLIGRVKAGDLSLAQLLAGPLHYQVGAYSDPGDKQAILVLLQESAPIANGWGLYAYRLAAQHEIIIEAPHPVSDERSEYVAMDVFRALQARALMIAGAHRDANQDGSADVAHNPATIFESVQEALLAGSAQGDGSTIILQIHGFATSKHKGYPAVVVGVGKQPSSAQAALAQRIVDALTRRGVDSAVCHDEIWEDVCGTSNVQLASANGAIFIHMELAPAIRDHDQDYVAALVEALSK